MIQILRLDNGMELATIKPLKERVILGFSGI
jgi:hypothetical protein